uniref:Uncharacterized protein LOC100374412 n=1 Tax=Saccoglossus kowalevskii TaxID=10224 RepID=A0ABM0M4A2_SACKO|nr:PREDICTED: uncharacterized protein LOC100374412 [Saccoglossus kowalevskii]
MNSPHLMSNIMSPGLSESSSTMTTSTLASTSSLSPTEKTSSILDPTDDIGVGMKLRRSHKDDFRRHKKHSKIDKFDEFQEWIDGDASLRYSPKDADARKHLSGWAMRNTNNHNKKVLKKSCLGVFVCSKSCVNSEGERTSVRPATSDRARKKQGEKKCPNPECDGRLVHVQCAGKGGYPVTHFWRPMELVVIFQSKGYHDHPRPDVVKTTSSAKIALLEYHRSHRHERPKEICKKIGVHIHKSFNRVDRVARQLREAQTLLGGGDVPVTQGRPASYSGYAANGQQSFHTNPGLEQWYQSSNEMYSYGLYGGSHNGMSSQYSSDNYYSNNSGDYGYYNNSVDEVDFSCPNTYFQKPVPARNDGNGKKSTIPLLQNMLKRRQMMKEMKDKTHKLTDGQLSDIFENDKVSYSERNKEYYDQSMADSTTYINNHPGYELSSPTKRKAPPLLYNTPSLKRVKTHSESDVEGSDGLQQCLTVKEEEEDSQNASIIKRLPSDTVSAEQKLNDSTTGDLPSLLDFFDVRGTVHENTTTVNTLKSTNSAFSPTIPTSQREFHSESHHDHHHHHHTSSESIAPISNEESSTMTSSNTGAVCTSHRENMPTSPPASGDPVFSELTNVCHSYSRGTPEVGTQGPTMSQLTGSHGYSQDEDNGTYIDLLVSMYLGNNNNDKPLSTLKHEFHVYTDTFNKSRAQFMQQDMSQHGYDHYKSANQYDFTSWYESDHWRNAHAHARMASHGYAEHTPLSPMPYAGHYEYPSMQFADWYNSDPMSDSSRLLMSQALNYPHGNSGILYSRSLF